MHWIHTVCRNRKGLTTIGRDATHPISDPFPSVAIGRCRPLSSSPSSPFRLSLWLPRRTSEAPEFITRALSYAGGAGLIEASVSREGWEKDWEDEEQQEEDEHETLASLGSRQRRLGT